jgi:hypothetical protein
MMSSVLGTPLAKTTPKTKISLTLSHPPPHRRTPMPAHGNLTIVQGEPDLPDFDIELIEDLDADLLNDPCLGGSEF